MGSRKRSALRRQRDAFIEDLYGADDVMGDVFAREERRRASMDAEREASLRKKACESKNRYATQAEAKDAIASCAAYGRTGLHSYRCPYCRGWHLTSHPNAHNG